MERARGLVAPAIERAIEQRAPGVGILADALELGHHRGQLGDDAIVGGAGVVELAVGELDVGGQERGLDIKVQDLASGRFPEELYGRMWEQGMIGDDEELWPAQGEYWADEYEGWR